MFLADAELCKGSTTDSDSVCLGSNPSSAAMNQPGIFRLFRGLILTIEVWLSLVERYVRDVEAVCSNHITSTKKG